MEDTLQILQQEILTAYREKLGKFRNELHTDLNYAELNLKDMIEIHTLLFCGVDVNDVIRLRKKLIDTFSQRLTQLNLRRPQHQDYLIAVVPDKLCEVAVRDRTNPHLIFVYQQLKRLNLLQFLEPDVKINRTLSYFDLTFPEVEVGTVCPICLEENGTFVMMPCCRCSIHHVCAMRSITEWCSKLAKQTEWYIATNYSCLLCNAKITYQDVCLIMPKASTADFAEQHFEQTIALNSMKKAVKLLHRDKQITKNANTILIEDNMKLTALNK